MKMTGTKVKGLVAVAILIMSGAAMAKPAAKKELTGVVNLNTATAAQLFHEGAVHDAELEAELVAHLVAPLELQAGGTHDEHGAGTVAQEQLLGDETGLDGLAETHVVGDEQVHARHGEGACDRVELVVLERDAAAEGGVELLVVGGSHGAPADGIEEGLEAMRRVEAAGGVRQGVALEGARVGFEFPDDLEGLAVGVVLDGLQSDQVQGGREDGGSRGAREMALDLGDDPAALADDGELALDGGIDGHGRVLAGDGAVLVPESEHGDAQVHESTT
jgi:hypothetical protein